MCALFRYREIGICFRPEIEKVELPSIKSVLDTEREIRKEKNYRKIVTFLEHLEKVNEVEDLSSMEICH